jgi:hypothetical protein
MILMRTETIKFNDFMSGEYSLRVKKIKEIRRNRIYKITLVSGLTLVMIASGTSVFAAGTLGIEKGAYEMYKTLLMVGKWIIIVKGGIDTVNAMLQGDHAAAKRGFLTYLVVYLILNGLPWAMDQVDGLFDGLNNPAHVPTPANGVAQ